MYNFQIVTLQPDSPEFGVAVKMLQAYTNFKETFVRNALGEKLTTLLEKIVEIKTLLAGALLTSHDPNQDGISDDVRAVLVRLKSIEVKFEKEAEEPWQTYLKKAVTLFENNFATYLDSMVMEVQQTLREALEVTT